MLPQCKIGLMLCHQKHLTCILHAAKLSTASPHYGSYTPHVTCRYEIGTNMQAGSTTCRPGLTRLPRHLPMGQPCCQDSGRHRILQSCHEKICFNAVLMSDACWRHAQPPSLSTLPTGFSSLQTVHKLYASQERSSLHQAAMPVVADGPIAWV